MLKATAGGGGRGIRVVTSDDELTDAFERTRDEAARAFGSGVVFLERLVTGARHVEVQVIADGQGTAWALGVRDCSVQRRNQKVIEESASPVLTDEQVARASRRRPSGWPSPSATAAPAPSSSCTSPAEQDASRFLEVNTRLQVEHPITEVTTGFDLVKAQLHVAAGGRLEGARPAEVGHAVEARLNAEDPDRDFAPSPGRIALLEPALRPRRPGRHRRQRGRPDPGGLRLDDRQDHRLRSRPRTRRWRGCAGRWPTPPSSSRAARRTRASCSTCSTSPRSSTAAPTPAGSTGSAARAARARTGTPASRWSPRRSRRTRSRSAAERLHFLATAHGGRPQARHEVGRAIDLKLRGATSPGHRRPGRPDPVPGRLRRRARRPAVVDAELEQLDEYAEPAASSADQRVPAGQRHPRPGPSGRGRRHHPPGHPRRGRRAALTRAGAGGRDAGRGRRRRSRRARRCWCSRA